MLYFLGRNNWQFYRMLLGVSHRLMKVSELMEDGNELFVL